ncbi:hypothetical protein VTO42DRAFT_4252 [Malbranchea cinnamomea]
MQLLRRRTKVPVPRGPGGQSLGAGSVHRHVLHRRNFALQAAWRPDGHITEIPSSGLTLAMNELVRVPTSLWTGLLNGPGPLTRLRRTLRISPRSSFFTFQYQRNDAVDDENDCRKKYIARCLFRKIARAYFQADPGPFRLYCDDFRPSNVPVTSDADFRVAGVIDWEYTYVAPAEFTLHCIMVASEPGSLGVRSACLFAPVLAASGPVPAGPPGVRGRAGAEGNFGSVAASVRANGGFRGQRALLVLSGGAEEVSVRRHLLDISWHEVLWSSGLLTR